MLNEERQIRIVQMLNKKSTIQVKDLVDQFDVSESTIRRDLTQLESQGLLIRIHGGAKRMYHIDSESSIQEKSVMFPEEKKLIGQYAASLVSENDVIYLDAGTTTLTVIPYLSQHSQLTVVTNGLAQAESLSQYGIETILLGGKLKGRTQAIVGTTALKQLLNYRFNRVFIGINGIDLTYGLTTPDIEESDIKSLVMTLSNEVYFLADASKFTKVSFSQVAPLENQTIITNHYESQLSQDFKEKANIVEVNH